MYQAAKHDIAGGKGKSQVCGLPQKSHYSKSEVPFWLALFGLTPTYRHQPKMEDWTTRILLHCFFWNGLELFLDKVRFCPCLSDFIQSPTPCNIPGLPLSDTFPEYQDVFSFQHWPPVWLVCHYYCVVFIDATTCGLHLSQDTTSASPSKQPLSFADFIDNASKIFYLLLCQTHIQPCGPHVANAKQWSCQLSSWRCGEAKGAQRCISGLLILRTYRTATSRWSNFYNQLSTHRDSLALVRLDIIICFFIWNHGCSPEYAQVAWLGNLEIHWTLRSTARMI